MFLLVPAYPGCPGSKAVKWSLLLLLLLLLLFSALFDMFWTRSPMFDSLQRRNNSHGLFENSSNAEQTVVLLY